MSSARGPSGFCRIPRGEPCLSSWNRHKSLVDGEGAARFLADGGCRIALVTEPEKAAFMATLAGLSRQAKLLDRVAGMNVVRVDKADIGVYRLRSP